MDPDPINAGKISSCRVFLHLYLTFFSPQRQPSQTTAEKLWKTGLGVKDWVLRCGAIKQDRPETGTKTRTGKGTKDRDGTGKRSGTGQGRAERTG
jgi:hypothetical protein